MSTEDTSNNDDDRATSDELFADYLRRVDAGEAVDIEALCGDHREFADELAEFLSTAQIVNEMAGPTIEEVEPRESSQPVDDSSRSLDSTRSFVIGSDGSEGTLNIESDDRESRSQCDLPRQFGAYELLAEIGRGGMGIVYLARQTKLDRMVAVKVIKCGDFASETELARFRTEAQAAASLNHPNIVSVHDVGMVNGQHFFSMDYIDGTDLRKTLGDGPLEARVAADYMLSVAEAIAAAHARGILHRDLKPANILIDGQGRALVSDFGLAKRLEEDAELTDTGTTVGTPSYMSPEQAGGKPLRPSTDVYSLGAILYELVTGQPPFRGESPLDTILAVIQREPIRPSRLRKDIERDLETVIMKCLEKSPDRRYESAGALAEELDRFLRGQPIHAQPASIARQSARWCRDIPIIAALTGKPTVASTAWQRRAQWVALGLVLLTVLALVRWIQWGDMSLPMPDRIRLASAVRGGEYDRLSREIRPLLEADTERPVEVIATAGSVENRDKLVSGEADLVLLQTTTAHSPRIAVVAPLYFDFVFIVVRRQSTFNSLSELRGEKISIGIDGSGMQLSAMRLLRHFEFANTDLQDAHVHFTELLKDPTYSAAVITTGLHNFDLERLLRSGEFRLLALEDRDVEALTGALFTARTIPQGTFSTKDNHTRVPKRDVHALATTTFLAADRRASDALVTKTLTMLYDPRHALVKNFDLFSQSAAAEWQMLDLHPAARRFYQSVVDAESAKD